MHRSPRQWPPSDDIVQVIHVNVGPEKANGARSLVDNVLPNQDGGYHWVFDNTTGIRCADDDEYVYGAKGCDVNSFGLHYCIIGYPDQSREQWLDDYSMAAMRRCAQQVARDAAKYRITITHPTLVLQGQVGHVDVTKICNVQGGHWDPGPHFPWDVFMSLVRSYGSDPQPSELHMAQRVLQPGKKSPNGRGPIAKLVPGHGIALVNGARIQGDSGPTPFGVWVTQPSQNASPMRELVEIRPGEKYLGVAYPTGGVVVVFEDDSTYGPYLWK